DTMQLSALQAKVIVVMGEFEAQQLLDNALTIKQLRGKKHMLVDRPVVVTYSLQHLLKNLSDKAMAWEDLCLARLTITNL
ncbi:MAG TPA: uracil-DNA glycosylase, partial [Methylophilaceae bacterium]|nr:uracil-DNA glycosylase [Methylophilaceae bacterium]